MMEQRYFVIIGYLDNVQKGFINNSGEFELRPEDPDFTSWRKFKTLSDAENYLKQLDDVVKREDIRLEVVEVLIQR